MGVPKRKHSKRRTRSRSAQAMRLSPQTIRPCPQCGTHCPPHRVCAKCGYYRGREVVSKEE